jgi:hypothetical protein
MDFNLLKDWSIVWLKECGESSNICPDDTVAMDPETMMEIHYTSEEDYLEEYGADTYVLAYVSPSGTITKQV